MDRLERELVAAERAACADLVRAAGCLCWIIREADDGFGGVISEQDDGEDGLNEYLEEHDPRCPHFLAAAIETRAALEPLRRPDRLDPQPSEPPPEEFP